MIARAVSFVLATLAVGSLLTRCAGAEDALISDTIARGIAATQRAAARYPEYRECFSCHHQTLPMLAQRAAQLRSVSIDQEQFAAQLKFTEKSFSKRVERLREGTGIGGEAMTVVYALWAFAVADSPANETSTAMVDYLLKSKLPAGDWVGQSVRPPLEESRAMCTTLAIYGLQRYKTDEHAERATSAIEKAKALLAACDLVSQEDANAKLWGLHLLGAADTEIAAARAEVLKRQRDDGGWSQLAEMASDAYATGQALWILHTTGLPSTEATYLRGVQWLVKHQRPDGNWHVVTRSKPIQTYYDSDDEDPLGKDQFISVPATSWAVAALCAATVEVAK